MLNWLLGFGDDLSPEKTGGDNDGAIFGGDTIAARSAGEGDGLVG